MLSGETAPLRLQLQRLGRRTHPVLRGCRKGRCGAGSRGPVTPGSARLQPRPQQRRQAERASRAGLAELGYLGGGCGCGAGVARVRGGGRAGARADGTRRGGRAGQASAAGMVLAAAGARELKPERSRHGDAAAASRVSELTGGGRGRCGRAGPAAGRAAGGTQPGWRAGRHRAVCGEGPPPVSGSLGRAEHPRDGDRMRARPSEKEAAKYRRRCREEFHSACLLLRIPSKILSEELAHHSERAEPRLNRACDLFYLALQKIISRNHSIFCFFGTLDELVSVRPIRHRCLFA